MFLGAKNFEVVKGHRYTTTLGTMGTDGRLFLRAGRERQVGVNADSFVFQCSRFQRTYGRTNVGRSTSTLWTTILINQRGLEELGEGILYFEKRADFIIVD